MLDRCTEGAVRELVRQHRKLCGAEMRPTAKLSPSLPGPPCRSPKASPCTAGHSVAAWSWTWTSSPKPPRSTWQSGPCPERPSPPAASWSYPLSPPWSWQPLFAPCCGPYGGTADAVWRRTALLSNPRPAPATGTLWHLNCSKGPLILIKAKLENCNMFETPTWRISTEAGLRGSQAQHINIYSSYLWQETRPARRGLGVWAPRAWKPKEYFSSKAWWRLDY